MSEAATPPSRRIHTLLAGLLWAGLVGQAVCGGITLWSLLAQVPVNLGRFREDGDDPPPSETVAAMRALPGFARALPRDARVLAVSGLLAPVQFEYWFLPRPFRLLQAWSDELIATVVQHLPSAEAAMRHRREILEAKGTLLTPARLQEELAHTDFVLLAGPPPPEWAAITGRVTLLAERWFFALYGVKR